MRLNKRNSGSGLVIVLGMLAVLMLMAVSFSIIMRVERSGTTNLRHSLTAQNGIQSAIAIALSDIDKDLEDSIAPDKWENGVMASYGEDVSYDLLQADDGHSKIKLMILNERAQRHLNPTTRALVKNAIVDWRLLYAGVPLSNYEGNHLKEDAIVGRVAYVAVNTTGYLDLNAVSESGEYAIPEETPQFNNDSFAKIGKKNVRFDDRYFAEVRKEESKHGFTSFADFTSINEQGMYKDGKVVNSPKMFINLFQPNLTSCLFLPDVFGPSANFGMSPYPPRVERDSNDPFADVVLTEAVKVDGVATLTEDVMQNVYVAFCNMFARENWTEESSYGEGKTQYTNPVRNVEWPFVYMGSIKRSTLTRADLALLSFAEYYSYKSGRALGDNEYVEMAIDVINEGGRPKINDVLDAPCFKPVPMVSSLLGYTEKPETEDDDDIKIYHHDGNGKFSPVGDDAVIPPETTTAKYYAKYELPVSFVVSATSPYKNSVEASLDGKIMFGPGADGKDLFAHIHDKISGNPKIVIDPESKFADSVKSGEDLVIQDKDLCSVNAGLGGIKVVRDLKEKIEVYIQCKDASRKSTEDAPITIKEIKNLFKWEDAQFDINSLEKYSIDVFAQIDVKASGQEVQYVPGKRIRSRKGPEGYVHFKLPLFGKGEKHRVGYAMALDPRFASATYCLNEFRENGAIESFPFWVNNAMAEKFGEFSKLKAFEMNADDPDDLATGGRTPDIANPYGKLAMGFNIDDDGLEDKSFWESLFKFGDFSKDYGTPYPDTLHKVPGGIQLVNDGGFDKKDLQIDFGTRGSGIDNLGDFGSFCIGPWETISLYRTQTPEGKYDFHTVFDFFTTDNPSLLVSGKLNLNAPPLLVSQDKSYKRVKLAVDHRGDYKNPKKFSVGGNIKNYVDASNGMNPEPLMAIIYGLGFDYNISWEIASRIISQNIDYDKKDGIRYFKDISQLGYSNSANDALLTYILNEDNSEIFEENDGSIYSDQLREQLIGKIARNVTTRGQTFTIVIRSDAFAPKLGSDSEGTTLASKVAIVEAWRDTEPARDSKGEIITDDDGNIVKYHNWHIRSVRIVD